MKRMIAFLLVALLCVPALASCKPAPTPDTPTGDAAVSPADIVSVTTTNYQIDNAMLSFFLNSIYQSDVYQYSSYLSVLGLDPEKSLKEQTYGNGTWFDYYLSAATANLKANILFAEYARAEGMELNEEEKSEIDSYIASIESYASENSLEVASFVTDYYGDGVTLDVMRRCLELQQMAYKAYQAFDGTLSYTEDELAAYYAENAQKFQYFDYNSYSFTTTLTEDASTEEVAAAMAALKTEADKLAAATTEEEFNTLLTAYLTASYAGDASKTADVIANEVAATFSENTAYSTLAGLGFAEGTEYKAGISAVVEGSKGYTVNFIAAAPARHDVTRKSVRHILLTASTYETEEAARAKADELLTGFLSGLKTEEAFAALAGEFSEDPGSKDNGGLYDDVSLYGSWAESFRDWSCDAARVPGDTGVVSSTSGIHVMYFVGNGAPEWQFEVTEEMKNVACDEKIEELAPLYSYTENTENMNKLDV